MKKVQVSKLVPYKNNARTHSQRQIEQIAKSIKSYGFVNPVLVDKENQIIAGHGRVEAAKLLGLTEVPCILIEHLTPAQKRAYIIADNKLAEKAGWDEALLKIELQGLLELDEEIDLTTTGLEMAEIDILLHEDAPEQDKSDALPEGQILAKVKSGQIWQLGQHRLICADSLQKTSYMRLLGQERATVVISDPPYNVKVDGHIRSKGTTKFKEFKMASGELTDAEFGNFLSTAFKNFKEFSIDGSLHYHFIDWRGVALMCNQAKSVYADLKNILIWDKCSGGMGSMYRSRHEMICLFKKGRAPHINNIELGQHGRYRTNVISYPGVYINNKVNKEAIKLHPTCKPVGLLADLIWDCTRRGDIVLDGFGGSGSTLLAAERTGRKARLIELDPSYCDVIIWRWEKATGQKAKLLKRWILK